MFLSNNVCVIHFHISQHPWIASYVVTSRVQHRAFSITDCQCELFHSRWNQPNTAHMDWSASDCRKTRTKPAHTKFYVAFATFSSFCRVFLCWCDHRACSSVAAVHTGMRWHLTVDFHPCEEGEESRVLINMRNSFRQSWHNTHTPNAFFTEQWIDVK